MAKFPASLPPTNGKNPNPFAKKPAKKPAKKGKC